MDKMKKEILVVSRENLLGTETFQGFKHHHECNFLHRICTHKKPMVRGPAEEDPSHKQPIGYAIIYHEPTKRIFAFQRQSKHTESRLGGKWSFGIGGHIDAHEIDLENPVEESTKRELQEEVHIQNYTTELLGYINDDSIAVGEVHFGVVYLIKTTDDVTPRDDELASGRFVTKEEMKEIMNECDLETWSQISWPIIERLL